MIRAKQRLIQIACLAVSALLLWPLPFWRRAPKFVSQMSPFVAICDSIALRFVGVGAGIGLVFAVIAVLRRRWFCGYACPVGLLLDGVSHFGLKRTSWWTRCAPLGQYAALLSIAGAAVGYPFLLWMDPLAIFSGSFAMRTSGNVLSGILAGFGIGMLLLLSLTSGSIWCARLCPLGGTLDLLASIRQVFKGGAKSATTQVVPAGSGRVRAFGGRRSFLFIVAGAGIGLFGKWLGAARGEHAPLRPPGAVIETNFAGLCLRCSNCVRACPTGIIHHDSGQAGIAGLLAPAILYERNYCLEECNACTQVCPSGALRALDLEQKQEYVIGEALVNMQLCVLALGKVDCDACMRSCPFNAVRIYWDEAQYVAYPVVDREKCNGCGACEVACPTYEEKAIRVWKRVH
jgi:ferredoxin-type protein NapF